MISTYKELADKYHLDMEQVYAAIKNIQDKSVVLVGVSGKIASGKDTIAPLVVSELGYSFPEGLSFADHLKNELKQIITIVNKSQYYAQAEHFVKIDMYPKNSYYKEVVEALYDPIKSGEITNQYSRHPQFRRAIQIWATEVRRAEDPLYWVRQTARDVVAELARKRSVEISDVRFPNEADFITDLRGVLVRLNISQEEQIKRMIKRDKYTPDLKNLVHPSETALDDYNFEYSITVDGLDPLSVAERVTLYIKGPHRHRPVF